MTRQRLAVGVCIIVALTSKRGGPPVGAELTEPIPGEPESINL